MRLKNNPRSWRAEFFDPRKPAAALSKLILRESKLTRFFYYLIKPDPGSDSNQFHYNDLQNLAKLSGRGISIALLIWQVASFQTVILPEQQTNCGKESG